MYLSTYHVKQLNSLKVRSILHEYVSEFTSEYRSTLSLQILLLLSEKWQKVYGGSTSPHGVESINVVSFIKLKVARHF